MPSATPKPLPPVHAVRLRRAREQAATRARELGEALHGTDYKAAERAYLRLVANFAVFGRYAATAGAKLATSRQVEAAVLREGTEADRRVLSG